MYIVSFLCFRLHLLYFLSTLDKLIEREDDLVYDDFITFLFSLSTATALPFSFHPNQRFSDFIGFSYVLINIGYIITYLVNKFVVVIGVVLCIMYTLFCLCVCGFVSLSLNSYQFKENSWTYFFLSNIHQPISMKLKMLINIRYFLHCPLLMVLGRCLFSFVF